MSGVLEFLGWLTGLAWPLAYALTLIAALRIPHLDDLCGTDQMASGAGDDTDADDPLPLLSVIVTARNEAASIRGAVSTILAQDYPALEIVLVNDRSTDGTDRIIDGMAAGDRRIVPVHIDHLPDGWLGKVHALEAGRARTHGEWLLFCDADVHMAAGLLRKAVCAARAQEVDHLSLIPRTLSTSYLQEVVMRAFSLLFALAMRLWLPRRSRWAPAVGLGVFNMVRRSALEATPGLAWLRMEVADDLGLGLLMKQAGKRSLLAQGNMDLEVVWYTDLVDMARGLEKNIFGVAAGWRLWRMLLLVLALWAWVLVPVLGLLLPGWLPWQAGAIAVLSQAAFVLILLASGARFWRACLLLPLGVMIFSVFLLRAGIVCLWRGGIRWRDTFYPLAALRAGQLVRLP